MEYDLPQGLHELAGDPPVGPLPARQVLARVRRGRAIRTAATALATAAVIVGAAALVYAAPWSADPVPPAISTPTPEPSATPTPEPAPEPPTEPDAPSVLFDPASLDSLFVTEEALREWAGVDLEQVWESRTWGERQYASDSGVRPESCTVLAMLVADEPTASHSRKWLGEVDGRPPFVVEQYLALLPDEASAVSAFEEIQAAAGTCREYVLFSPEYPDLGDDWVFWTGAPHTVDGGSAFWWERSDMLSGVENPGYEGFTVVGNVLVSWSVSVGFDDTPPARTRDDLPIDGAGFQALLLPYASDALAALNAP